MNPVQKEAAPSPLDLAKAWQAEAVKQRLAVFVRRRPDLYNAEFWAAVDYLSSQGWHALAITRKFQESSNSPWSQITEAALHRSICRHLQQVRSSEGRVRSSKQGTPSAQRHQGD